MNAAPPPEPPKTAQTIAIPVKSERATEPSAPSPAPARSALPSLDAALDGDDPLASTARVLAWLDAATVGDLRAMAAEPGKFLNPSFTGFYAEFRAAYFEAIVERWFALDPDGALPTMQQMQAEQGKKDPYALRSLLAAVARLRPELALGKLPVEFKDGRLDYVTRSAWQALGERDANAARRFLDRYTDPKMRRAAEVAIAEGVAAPDPLAAVALARQMNDEDSIYQAALASAERMGAGMVRQVFAAAEGRLDRVRQLPELLLRYPDLAAEIKSDAKSAWAGKFPDEQQAAADRLPPEERARLLAAYDTLPASARDDLATALASAWARTDPRAAADWALAHAKAEDRKNAANGAAQQVFLRWVNNDTDAALAWWRALPASPLREALGNEASTFVAEQAISTRRSRCIIRPRKRARRQAGPDTGSFPGRASVSMAEEATGKSPRSSRNFSPNAIPRKLRHGSPRCPRRFRPTWRRTR